jgi:hypothetical protein
MMILSCIYVDFMMGVFKATLKPGLQGNAENRLSR